MENNINIQPHPAKQKGIVATLCIVCTLFVFSCQSEEEVDDNLLVEMGVNGEQLPLLKLKGFAIAEMPLHD